MTYGAYALSENNTGIIWGDFNDSYYYRGYFNMTSAGGTITIPGYPAVGGVPGFSGYLPGPLVFARSRFISHDNPNDGYREQNLVFVDVYYWLPKFGDNDLFFMETKGSIAGAIVETVIIPKNTMAWSPTTVTIWEPYDWWQIRINLQYPLSYFDVGNGYINPNWDAVYDALPIMHMFCTWTNGFFTGDSHGLAVYRADGSTAFNSAQNPLRIKTIMDASMPTQPAPYSFYLEPINVQANAHAACTRPMYHFPALAQAVQEFAIQGSNTVSSYFGLVSNTQSWDYVFWAIYGGGFYGGNSSLNTKWCYQGAGFFGSEQSSSSFLFDLIPTGSSSNGFGTPPFRYNSVNYTGIPVLVADAQDYA